MILSDMEKLRIRAAILATYKGAMAARVTDQRCEVRIIVEHDSRGLPLFERWYTCGTPEHWLRYLAQRSQGPRIEDQGELGITPNLTIFPFM